MALIRVKFNITSEHINAKSRNFVSVKSHDKVFQIEYVCYLAWHFGRTGNTMFGFKINEYFNKDANMIWFSPKYFMEFIAVNIKFYGFKQFTKYNLAARLAKCFQCEPN